MQVRSPYGPITAVKGNLLGQLNRFIDKRFEYNIKVLYANSIQINMSRIERSWSFARTARTGPFPGTKDWSFGQNRSGPGMVLKFGVDIPK